MIRQNVKSPRNRYIAMAVAAYASFALLWIFLSDQLLASMISTEKILQLSTIKGTFFVLITSLLLVYALYSVPSLSMAARLEAGVTHPARRWAWGTRYGFALISTLACIFLHTYIGFEHPLLVFYMTPIILSALIGGIGPGLLATGMAAIFIDYRIIPPQGSLRIAAPHDLFQWGFLIINGILISMVSEMMLRSRQQTEANRQLQALILAGIGDAIIAVDEQGKVYYLNPEALRLCACSESAALNRPLGEIFCLQNAPADWDSAGGCALERGDYLLQPQLGPPVPVSVAVTFLPQESTVQPGRVIVFRDETVRQQAQAELQNVAVKFRTLYESSSDAIMLCDEQGFFDCNEATLQVFGCLSRDEFIHKHPSRFSPPIQPGGEDSDCLSRAHIATAFRQGSDRFEWVHMRLNGTLFPAEVWLTGLELEGRRVLQATVRDISERKQAEETLRRINRELLAISSCNQVLVRAEDEQVLLNNICRIVCDEAGYRMAWVGYAEHDEAKRVRPVAWAGFENGILAQSQITWDDTEYGRGPSGTAIRSAAPVSLKDLASDSSVIPWRDAALQRGYRSCIALPLKDEKAATFGVFNIYSSQPAAFTAKETRLLEELSADLAFGITTLRARQARQQAEQKQQASEARLQLTLQATQIGIWDWDVANDNWYASPVYYTALGYAPRSGQGDRQEWAERLHPDDRAQVMDKIQNVLSRYFNEYCYEARVRHADGSYRWQQVRGFGIERDPSGKVTRMLGTRIDIDERKRVEAELQQYREHLEELVAQRTAQLEEARNRAANSERLAALGALVAGMAHELNTPIGICVTASSTIVDMTTELKAKLVAGVKRSDLQHYLDDTIAGTQLVCSNLDRAAALVAKFKHISLDQLCPQRHEFNLAALVDEAVALHLPKNLEKRHALHLDIPADIQFDSFPGPLNQVLSDLFSNALMHGLVNRESGVIGIRARQEGDSVRIAFSDNGIGMSPEVMTRAFDPFFTTQFGQGCSGLGLYVAYNIVTGILGGSISVSSQEGNGCTFIITLPVKAP